MRPGAGGHGRLSGVLVCLGAGQAVGLGAGLDDGAVNVSLSTIAAQSQGSVKVLAHPLKESLDTIATLPSGRVAASAGR